MIILIAGDFCPQNRVSQQIDKGNYESVLSQVREVTSEADYAIVNFECPVTKGGEKPIVKQGPNLHCSYKGIEAAKWAGFDCVTLANNHFRDYGDEGVKNTIDACMSTGIDTVGGGTNLHEASSILYKQIGERTLAVINCCEHEFSIATDSHGGANPLNPVQQYYAIKEAKAKSDYVLVIVHGGHEHWQLPSPRMQETYRFFIDAGADAVVNHHQHCYSGYETYKGAPIIYGLGNFCFDESASSSNGIWNEGYMVEITFNNSVKFEIYPYYQCGDEPVVKLLQKNAFENELDKLNEIIVDSEALKKKTDQYYQSCKKQYSKIFEPFMNKYYLALRNRGLFPSFVSHKRRVLAENYIGCESHRDKLLYYLNAENSK